MAPMIPLCPQALANPLVRLARRDFVESTKSTAESFKNWNSCMDNTFCKIVAIVGMVLAGLLLLWVFTALIRCCCCGVSMFGACCAICSCCTCCCSDKATRDPQEGKYSSANNPHMYPASNPYQPYNYQPQPAYNPQTDFEPDFNQYRSQPHDDHDFHEMKRMAPTNPYEAPTDQYRRF